MIGMLPKRGYLLLVTGFFIGLLVFAALSRIYGVRRATCVGEKPESIELVFLYTSEKDGWIRSVKPLYEEWFYKRYGIRVNLVLYVTGSHESVDLILQGSVKPHVWSPASSIWIPFFEKKWGEMHGGENIVSEWYPLVLSPTVLAGWEGMVKKYNIKGYRDLYILHRRGVRFKYGHPDPMLSNGGIIALLMEFCAALNKTPDQLTPEDLTSKNAIEFVKAIESHAVYYGKSTGFFGSWAADNGPDAISFFTVYENVVIENYPKARAKWGQGLVAVYPEIGVVYSDHPLVILNASWVGPWERLASVELLNFLLKPEIQRMAVEHGFRPVNPLVSLDEKAFGPGHGVLHKVPVQALKPPSGDVLEKLFEVWLAVRNPGV